MEFEGIEKKDLELMLLVGGLLKLGLVNLSRGDASLEKFLTTEQIERLGDVTKAIMDSPTPLAENRVSIENVILSKGVFNYV